MLEKFETMIFDENCVCWDTDKNFNKMFLKHAESHLNDKLKIKGWLCLNEVYSALGATVALEAQVVGWKISDVLNGNNCVKFELEETDNNSNIVIKFKNMVTLL